MLGLEFLVPIFNEQVFNPTEKVAVLIKTAFNEKTEIQTHLLKCSK